MLATTEHDIPYQLGYFRPFHQRLRDSATAVLSSQPGAIASFVRRYRVDVLAVDRDVLRTARLPPRYKASLPVLDLAAARPALATAPCRRFVGRRVVLFDGACLARWADARSS